MRQEFERHRYVNQLKTVDVLLFNSHQEYQVGHFLGELIPLPHLAAQYLHVILFGVRSGLLVWDMV